MKVNSIIKTLLMFMWIAFIPCISIYELFYTESYAQMVNISYRVKCSIASANIYQRINITPLQLKWFWRQWNSIIQPLTSDYCYINLYCVYILFLLQLIDKCVLIETLCPLIIQTSFSSYHKFLAGAMKKIFCTALPNRIIIWCRTFPWFQLVAIFSVYKWWEI